MVARGESGMMEPLKMVGRRKKKTMPYRNSG